MWKEAVVAQTKLILSTSGSSTGSWDDNLTWNIRNTQQMCERHDVWLVSRNLNHFIFTLIVAVVLFAALVYNIHTNIFYIFENLIICPLLADTIGPFSCRCSE
jgi:hypothetical protein